MKSRILKGLRARFANLTFVALTLAVFVAGIVLLPASSRAVHAWMDVGWTFFSVLATVTCVRAALHVKRPGRRRAWWAFAAGSLGWALGIIQWSWLELVSGVVTPFPAIGDVGFLSLPVGLALGLFWYGSDSPGVPGTVKQIGDLGIVLSTIGLCSSFVLSSALVRADISRLYAATAFAYPVLHLSALFFTITTLWGRSWHKESVRVVGLLAAGTFVLAIVTTYYAQELLLATYEAGHLIDPLWPLTFALIHLAASEELARETASVEDEGVRVTIGDVLAPPVCVGATVIVGFSQDFRAHDAAPLLFAFGVVLALSLAVRNVAQRRIENALRDEVQARERQFITAQKMEAVATLAGGLAHDFNNLLTGVLGGVGMLRVAEKTGRHDPSHLDLVEQSAQRAAELTKRLLVFARRREATKAAMSPWEVVRRAAMLVRSAAPDNIVVREEGGPRTLLIEADASQLEHALVNLGLNAVHAMPFGGQLRFVLEVRGTGDAREVVFEVHDTGVGMQEHVREHIFEPFYSTRALGEGTGLGLAMVRSGVAAHGGRVEFDSRVGVGTTFRMFIPLVEAMADATLASVPPGSMVPGGETILVVDDRGVALLAAQALLESNGYRVLATSRVSEALDIAEGSESIDVLLIDIVMPDTDGYDVAAQIRQRRPGVPVVLATGHLPPTYLPAWVSSVVEKPYRPKALMGAIRKAIDEGRVRDVQEGAA